MAAFGALTWVNAQSPGIALVGAKVEIGNGTVLENATVAIENGKIISVGSGAAPAGFRSVDAKGLWVTAGWIDGTLTRGLKLPEPVANEARRDDLTAPASMRDFNRKGVRPELQAAAVLDLKPVLESAYSQGFTSALVVPGAGTFRGQGAWVWLREGESQAVVLRSPLGMGAALTPGSGAGFPSTEFGAMALFRQTMLDAQRYPLLPEAERPKIQEPLQALLPVLRREMPLLMFADEKKDIDRALGIAGEFRARTWLVGAREAFERADMIKAQQIPVVVSVAVGTEPGPSTDPDYVIPANVLAERRATWRERAMNLVQLEKAGIPFILTTLGDNTGDFLANVRQVVKLGLSREAALAGLTRHPASAFGLGQEMGTVAVGMRASLSVFDGDPFAEKTQVKWVVVDGNLVEVKS